MLLTMMAAATDSNMSGAAYILTINLAVAGLFCATFVAIAVYDGRHRSARWFALAYATGMAYGIAEFLIPVFTDARVAVFLGQAIFVATLLFLNIGIARRYGLQPPRNVLTAIFATSLVVGALIQDLPRESLARMFGYQAPFAAMEAVGLTIVLRSSGRRFIDNALAGFLGVSALHYLSKPFVAMMVGGTGGRAQDYLATTYAMVSQSMGAVLVVATGLLLLSMLVADVLRDATERSETDQLSGLYNRRGFEHRLEKMIAGRGPSGIPITLVLCDLDHFKQINDSFGHPVGDRLIAEFAQALRRFANDHQVIGRIGGEEFAAVLPGSHVAAGRLFAQAVRTSYTQAASVHVPAGVRCSASFGVAELVPGEDLSSLMERADAALYTAKRDGRDRVRVGWPDGAGHSTEARPKAGSYLPADPAGSATVARR